MEQAEESITDQNEIDISIIQEPKLADRPQKLIIITGFGPFLGYDVNASWEAVRLLPNVLDFKGTQYVLEKQLVDVEYGAVDKAIQEIWAQKPELVIHCGVHGAASCVHIEKLAYNHKFKRRDYAGKRLPKGSAFLVNSKEGIDNDVIRCGLNVNKIVDVVAANCNCTPTATTVLGSAVKNVEVAKVSNDVGNYLCGYIYLKSLDINRRRSLFVHVPPINEPFSSSQTSDIILKIVEECVRQVTEDIDIKDTC